MSRCAPGSPSGAQFECGGANSYCPKGSTAPITVSVGYHSINIINADRETIREDQEICPTGHYCIAGVAVPCEKGFGFFVLFVCACMFVYNLMSRSFFFLECFALVLLIFLFCFSFVCCFGFPFFFFDCH